MASGSQVRPRYRSDAAAVAARKPAPVLAAPQVERRGPNRAQNVSRPVFGKARPAKEPAKALTQSLPTRKEEPVSTGTDDWTTF